MPQQSKEVLHTVCWAHPWGCPCPSHWLRLLLSRCSQALLASTWGGHTACSCLGHGLLIPSFVGWCCWPFREGVCCLLLLKAPDDGIGSRAVLVLVCCMQALVSSFVALVWFAV